MIFHVRENLLANSLNFSYIFHEREKFISQ